MTLILALLVLLLPNPSWAGQLTANLGLTLMDYGEYRFDQSYNASMELLDEHVCFKDQSCVVTGDWGLVANNAIPAYVVTSMGAACDCTRWCVGGDNDGDACEANTDCPGGGVCNVNVAACTDDTDAIQYAINTAAADGIVGGETDGGAIVLIPAAGCKVTSLALEDGVILRGVSQRSSYIVGTSGSDPITLANGVDNWGISDLTILAGDSCIKTTGVTPNGFIHNVTLAECETNGIDLDSGDTLRITGVNIQGVGGIGISATVTTGSFDNNLIHDIYITGTGEQGIYLGRAAVGRTGNANHLDTIKMANIGYDAIKLEYMTNTTVTNVGIESSGCDADDTYSHLYIGAGCSRIIVLGSAFQSSGYCAPNKAKYGMYVNASGCIIKGNVATGKTAGAYIYGNQNEVEWNNFSDEGGTATGGLLIRDPGTNPTMQIQEFSGPSQRPNNAESYHPTMKGTDYVIVMLDDVGDGSGTPGDYIIRDLSGGGGGNPGLDWWKVSKPSGGSTDYMGEATCGKFIVPASIAVQSLASNAISVALGSHWSVGLTAPDTLNDFTNEDVGQRVFLRFTNGNTTVDFTSTKLHGNQDKDWEPDTGDSMICTNVSADGEWYCLTSGGENTNANTECTGTTTFYSGDGTCVTLDGLEDFETPTEDRIPVGNGTGFDMKEVADSDGDAQCLKYDQGTNVFYSGTTYMHAPAATPPGACSELLGHIYTDTDLNLPCYCNGTNWVQMNDFSTVCS